MIIKLGKKVTDIIKCGKVVNKIIRNGVCVYQKSGNPPTYLPYLYTDKTTIWAEPEDIFDIFSNTNWVIYKEGDEPVKYLNTNKDTLWLTPIDTFDINSNVNWIIL